MKLSQAVLLGLVWISNLVVRQLIALSLCIVEPFCYLLFFLHLGHVKTDHTHFILTVPVISCLGIAIASKLY